MHKNISSIQYNFLNLPTKITYSSGKSASYVYNGAGEKLRTSYKASASATAVPTDYCGNMIYEIKSTGNSLQRFRFNGKEFDRTHGLDWYDYGARHMSPDVGRFTTIDPMAEKYYNISPYAYCANNPVNAIDIKGDSILVLIAPKGANGNGHLAALIQDSEGKWEYYSKNGTKGFFGLYGKPYNDNKGESPFTSVIEFLNNSEYNPIDEETNQSKYTEGYLIPTTSEEDVEAINAAKSELNKNYNVIGSNCAVTVQSALSAAGKKTGNPDDFRMFGNKDSFTSIVDYYIRSKFQI